MTSYNMYEILKPSMLENLAKAGPLTSFLVRGLDGIDRALSAAFFYSKFGLFFEFERNFTDPGK